MPLSFLSMEEISVCVCTWRATTSAICAPERWDLACCLRARAQFESVYAVPKCV
jgi:hypothetical protein